MTHDWTKDATRHYSQRLTHARGNDANGNPRRLWAVYDSRAILVALYDEGYRGKPDGVEGLPELPTLEISARQYRDLVIIATRSNKYWPS